MTGNICLKGLQMRLLQRECFFNFILSMENISVLKALVLCDLDFNSPVHWAAFVNKVCMLTWVKLEGREAVWLSG